MAGTQFCKFFGISFALILTLPTTARAESFLQQGESFYREGNFGKAAECLQRELQRNQYDPQAHYMLGNVYYELRRYSDAVREYNAALAIQPQGTVADYSHAALARMQQSGSAHSTATSTMSNDARKAIDSHGTHIPVHDGTAQSQSIDNESKQIQGSAQKISAQSKETEDRYSVECEARIRDVNRDLDLEIKRLEQEMNDNLAAPAIEPIYRSVGLRRSVARYVDTSKQPNEQVKAEYQQKIEAAKAKAGEKIASLKAALKTQQMSAEDSAITIDRDYVNRRQQANVKIAPTGTNIFVRNYETADDPSGNAVPIALPPAKSLQPISKTTAGKSSK